MDALDTVNTGESEAEEFRPLRPTPAEAPWYSIPDRKFVNVEHPAIVKNEDKAVRMLGGGKKVAKIFQPNPENEAIPNGLELRFRPGDALAPPIQGRPAKTRAVLVKVTVPKGKGPGPGWINGKEQDVPKSLRSLKGRYKAEIVGYMDHTVRFRDMADYQWNTRNSRWARNVEENMMEMDLQALKRFRMIDKISADENTEIMRPPNFTHIHYPHVYGFRQNPAIRVEMIDGEETLINAGARLQTQIQYGHWPSETVPMNSQLDAPRGRQLTACVSKLQELFNQRPIWTRRALANSMPRELWPQLKWAYPHVAYYWRSGPWRDTYVKLGVDPRKDKSFAKYQVAAFKMQQETKSGAKGWKHNKSHIFDGKTVVPDGRVWQFCDLKDPLLSELVDIQNFEAREICDHADGWYPNNRHFKIKAVMRKKLSIILAGKVVNDTLFSQLIKEPDIVAGGIVRRQGQERDFEIADLAAGEEDGDALVGLDEGGESAGSEGDGEDFEGVEESAGEEESSEDEEGDDTSPAGAPVVVKERDEKLQLLMKRFMQGQQHEGAGTAAAGRGTTGFGGDDFDILGDD